MTFIPNDESVQVANIYFQAQAIAYDAVAAGYDHHAVAEGLLQMARDVLADNEEFWTVFNRFKAMRCL